MVFTKPPPTMPSGKESASGGGDAGGTSSPATKNAAGRTTFRPPWVKEGPNPLPVPAAPWTLKNAKKNESNEPTTAALPQVQLRKTPVRQEKTQVEEAPEPTGPQLRKTKIQVKEPQENGTAKKETFVMPQLKKVPPKEEPTKLQSKEVKIPIKLKVVEDSPIKDEPKQYSNKIQPDDPDNVEKATPAKRNALVRNESMRRLSNSAPQAPPMPPPAPAMPKLIETKPLNEDQVAKLEQLRSRPKTRPDWAGMLKEIEQSKKLKHVECNDRSRPLLPKEKSKGQYLYDSEKANAHNELLKQIQGGIALKKTKTNDRSKPNLDGLRKIRRQMTIEEQIIKSQSMASMPPEEIAPEEVDEMDDIDKVRDDLQSTKQMLALELRNKEAQIRENKRLLARIQNLEAELEKAKSEGGSGKGDNQAEEKIVKSLKAEAEQARKTSEELEKKYTQTAEQLDNTKSELEEARKQNQQLEKKLQEAMQGKRHSISDRKASVAKEDDEDDFVLEESDEEEGLDEETKKERRAQREVKMLGNKLRSFKNKEDNAKKERVALKTQIKNFQIAMKEEKKKYKSLQKEVDKMAKLMKETSEDEDEDEEEEEKEEDEEETETESESSESESESDSDDSDSEKSQSEPEDAPLEKKKINLEQRGKRHENILGALKKGNFMLKANVERLQDDLNKQKELTLALQEDLDSVLAELG